MTALTKITAQLGSCLPDILSTIKKFGNSKDTDVQQRCLELTALLQEPDLMKEVLPVDASTEELDIDEDLSFLNGYVKQALENGAKAYDPPTKSNFASLVAGLGGFGDEEEDGLGLRYEAYDQPTIPDDDYDDEVDDDDDDDDDEEQDEKNEDVDFTNTRTSPQRQKNNLSSGGMVKGPWGAGGYQVELERKRKEEEERKLRQEEERIAAEAVAEELVDEEDEDPMEEEDLEEEEEDEEEEEKPRELTEREKLAASLFGGVAAPTATTKSTSKWSRRVGRRSKSPPKAVAQQMKPVAQKPENDDSLLGDLFGESSSEVTMSTTTTKQEDLDFLSNDVVDGSNNSSSNDLLGLDGFGMDEQVPKNQNEDDGMGLFDVDSPSTTMSSSSMPDLRRVVASPDILRLCAGGNTRIPSSNDENKLLDSHGTLQFSYFKILRAEDVVVVVFVGNAAMQTTQLAVAAASNVSGLGVSLSPNGSVDTSSVSSIRLSSVPSYGYVAMCARVSFRSNDIRGLDTASLQLKFQNGTSSIPMSVLIPLDSRDFLRPKRMATKQFGPRWTSSKRRGLGEKRIALHSVCNDLDDLVKEISEKIGLYPIETIHKTSEHIAALNIMGNTDMEALVHVKFTKKSKHTATMTIRAPPLLLEILGRLARTSIE